ncbi:MAG: AAA family ATPase, partial [Desulfobacca sp.]|nr:AAA family ATPase [Desulfobacca sp.]
MKATYRTFFGLTQEPFRSDLTLKEILLTPDLLEVGRRFEYTLRLGAIALVTGEIGSGKLTALRYFAAGLHPSEYQTIYITATSGSILELYRLFLSELKIDRSSTSRAVMIHLIKKEILEMAQGKKLKPVLIIDEASLMRLDVFAELHTLTQFEQDSKPYLSLILAGQSNLIDKLSYRASLPLSSRIIARSHLPGVNRQEMADYLSHHLSIAG